MTNLKTPIARSMLAPRGKPYFVPTVTPRNLARLS
jgi:hypothetical protein